MNYIILDLEWNQSLTGKEKEHKRLPFEIIEIGAIKCNDKMEKLDFFSQLIRPKVYKVLHYKSKEVTAITNRELQNGKSFQKVFQDFIKWCGEDYMFCTWGNMDLAELQKNVSYYKLPNTFQKPLFYFDIQKIFGLEYEEEQARKSLEYAVDFLKIPVADNFHRAVNDAMYTMEIMKKIPWVKYNNEKSIDYYQVPKNKKEEVYFSNSRYDKFISREFESKEIAMASRDITLTKCRECSRKMRKKIRWFSGNGKQYYCIAFCPDHGMHIGKIRMKKTENDGVFVIRLIKKANEKDCERITVKRQEISRKRRLKRTKKNPEL